MNKSLKESSVKHLALQPVLSKPIKASFAVLSLLLAALSLLGTAQWAGAQAVYVPPAQLGAQAQADQKIGVVTAAPFGAKGDGVTDDAAAVQATVTAYRHIYIPYTTGGVMIWGSPVVLPANETVTVDPRETIQLKSGANCALLRNLTVTGSSSAATEDGITVDGGIWDGNMAQNPGKNFPGSTVLVLYSDPANPVQGLSGLLDFVGCTHLTLRNLAVNNVSQFAVQVAGGHDDDISGITFSTGLDGLHINGPISFVRVANIRGSTGDDFVALNAWDWTYSGPFPSGGPITDFQISDLRPHSSAWCAVKMTTGTGANVSRVSVRDVVGSSGNCGVFIGPVLDAYNPSHTTGPGFASELVFNNINMGVANSQTISGFTYGCVFGLNTQITGMQVRGITAGSNSVAANYFQIGSGASLDSLTLSGVNVTAPLTNPTFINNAGSIADLFLSDVKATGTIGTTNNDSAFVATTGRIDHLRFDRSTLLNYASLFHTSASSIYTDTSLFGSWIQNTKHVFWATGSAGLEVRLIGNRLHQIANDVVRLDGSGPVLLMRSSANEFTAPASGAVPLVLTAGTAEWAGTDIPQDISLLAGKQAGDLAFNSNAALSCGTGLCLYTGTAWKNLATGATY